jgi:ketosteroid isomerase-like protein
MRKLLVITAFLLFAGIAFGQTSKIATVDIEAEKTALNELMDKFESAFKTQDVSTLASFLTEDALICGTDPSEFWNKQQITDLWTQMLVNTGPEMKYIGDRKIKVAPDGTSGIIVTQLIVPIYSPKIPWRQVYHCVKSNDKWMILFSNVAFIPYNEDIQKLNEAID